MDNTELRRRNIAIANAAPSDLKSIPRGANDSDAEHDEDEFAHLMGGADFGDEDDEAPIRHSLNSLRTSAPHLGQNMSSRLRNFMADSEQNFASRMFCEMMIRYPAEPCSRAEIEALVETFGKHEYLNAGPKGSHTHVVRFHNYVDAVKCYLQLNGAFVDPSARESAVAEWRNLVEKELADDSNKAWLEENPEEAAQLREELRSGELLGDSSALLIKPLDENERLVFITCDFFRAAFFPFATPRSRLLTDASRTPSKNPLVGLVDNVLAKHARMFSGVYGLVQSHEMKWDDFIFCVNYLCFFQGPSKNPKEDVAMQAIKALQSNKFNVTNYLAFVDTRVLPQSSTPQRTLVQRFIAFSETIAESRLLFSLLIGTIVLCVFVLYMLLASLY